MNREQLAILATELTDSRYSALLAAQDYEAIAALLNNQEPVSNPTPQPDIPARISWDGFVDALTATDVLALYGHGVLADHLRQALEANDRTIMLAIWRGLSPAMQAASRTAVVALANATEPDPAWQDTVPGDSRATELGLPRVTPADVQAVDNALP